MSALQRGSATQLQDNGLEVLHGLPPLVVILEELVERGWRGLYGHSGVPGSAGDLASHEREVAWQSRLRHVAAPVQRLLAQRARDQTHYEQLLAFEREHGREEPPGSIAAARELARIDATELLAAGADVLLEELLALAYGVPVMPGREAVYSECHRLLDLLRDGHSFTSRAAAHATESAPVAELQIGQAECTTTNASSRRRRRQWTAAQLDGAAAATKVQHPEWTHATLAKTLEVNRARLTDRTRPLKAYIAACELFEVERAERAENLRSPTRRDSPRSGNRARDE